jgi:hypothetical protein
VADDRSSPGREQIGGRRTGARRLAMEDKEGAPWGATWRHGHGLSRCFCFELLFCCCLVCAVCRKKEGEEKRRGRKEKEEKKGEK